MQKQSDEIIVHTLWGFFKAIQTILKVFQQCFSNISKTSRKEEVTSLTLLLRKMVMEPSE